MQELKTFNFEELPVRTLTIKDEPYFVGNDVAQILGYEDYRGAINKKVDIEDKLRSQIDHAGQKKKCDTYQRIRIIQFNLLIKVRQC